MFKHYLGIEKVGEKNFSLIELKQTIKRKTLGAKKKDKVAFREFGTKQEDSQ